MDINFDGAMDEWAKVEVDMTTPAAMTGAELMDIFTFFRAEGVYTAVRWEDGLISLGLEDPRGIFGAS